jgi:VIT1/CCC1 family predicted Fe2+/Mn2+ transporter
MNNTNGKLYWRLASALVWVIWIALIILMVVLINCAWGRTDSFGEAIAGGLLIGGVPAACAYGLSAFLEHKFGRLWRQ